MRAVALAAGLVAAFAFGDAPAWAATTCSARHQECLKFCASNYKGRPGCTSQCGDALPQCMSSGCWNTRMSNACGYTKG